MRHEAWEAFAAEMKKLLSIGGRKVIVLFDDIRLEMDSLTITEVCVVAEEELNVQLTFGEVRSLKTYGELRVLLEAKAGE